MQAHFQYVFSDFVISWRDYLKGQKRFLDTRVRAFIMWTRTDVNLQLSDFKDIFYLETIDIIFSNPQKILLPPVVCLPICISFSDKSVDLKRKILPVIVRACDAQVFFFFVSEEKVLTSF